MFFPDHVDKVNGPYEVVDSRYAFVIVREDFDPFVSVGWVSVGKSGELVGDEHAMVFFKRILFRCSTWLGTFPESFPTGPPVNLCAVGHFIGVAYYERREPVCYGVDNVVI